MQTILKISSADDYSAAQTPISDAYLWFDGLSSGWSAGSVEALEARSAAAREALTAIEGGVSAVAAGAMSAARAMKIAAKNASWASVAGSVSGSMSGLLRLGQSSLGAAVSTPRGVNGMLAASAVAVALMSVVEEGMTWAVQDQLRETQERLNHENAQSEGLRVDPLTHALNLNYSRVPSWARAGFKALAPKISVMNSPKALSKLLKLPIALDDAKPLSAQALATALLPKDPFLAIATQVEVPSTKPYFDAAGANIGMGYCIPQRLAAYGEPHVRDDFAKAGIDEKTSDLLLSKKRGDVLSAEITQSQALRLLMVTKEDYLLRAKRAVGEDVFNSLSVERQSALAYLSYNSNLSGFKKLPQAIAAGRETQAMREMTPSFRNENGALQKNYRLASYLWAAWSGHLGAALSDPAEHERLYAHDRGLFAFLKDTKHAKRDPAVSMPPAAVPLSQQPLAIVQQQMGPPLWASRLDPMRQTAAQVTRDLAFHAPSAPVSAVAKKTAVAQPHALSKMAVIAARKSAAITLSPRALLARRSDAAKGPGQQLASKKSAQTRAAHSETMHPDAHKATHSTTPGARPIGRRAKV